MVPGPGSLREPARGRRIGEGGRAGGCATRASQRSIFKAPSGFGQPPALPSLAPARPPPFRAAARRQPPGPPRRLGGASGRTASAGGSGSARCTLLEPAGDPAPHPLPSPSWAPSLSRPGRAPRSSFLSCSREFPAGKSLCPHAELKLLAVPAPDHF